MDFGSTVQEQSCANNSSINSIYRKIRLLTHPVAKQALQFWAARPRDGIVIGRDVPSRSIANLLSRVIVHEPIKGGTDAKVRLAGMGIRHRFGDDITGMTMSALFPTPDFPNRLESVMKAIRDDAPQYADCTLSNGVLDILHTELMIVPAVAPNRTAIWTITFCFFFN